MGQPGRVAQGCHPAGTGSLGQGMMPCRAPALNAPSVSNWRLLVQSRKKDQSPLTMAGSSTNPSQTQPRAATPQSPTDPTVWVLVQGSSLGSACPESHGPKQQNQPTLRCWKVRVPVPAWPPQSCSRSWSSRRRLSRRGPCRLSTPRSSFRRGR